MPAGGRPSIAARIGARARAMLDRARGRAIAGHVDAAREGVLYGWAWRADAPDCRLLVDIFVEGRFVGQALAHLDRPDLRDAGIGDGRYGFELLVGDRLTSDLRGVRAFALAGRRRVELMSPASRRETTSIGDPQDYLRATFAGLLARDGCEASPPARAPQSAHPRWERLLAPSAPGGPTNYIAHIAHREGIASDSDKGRLLRDYLLRYGRRRGRMRAPLSAGDIAYLTAGPNGDAPLAPGRAQALLGRGARNDDLAAVCAWAIYDSASLGVEDCLVPASHRRALATPDSASESMTAPLSPFMRRFLAGSPALTTIPWDDEAGRKLAWFALLLFATVMPQVLNYMPAEGVARFALAGAPDEAAFDDFLAKLFGATGYSTARWRADIARAGYDLARQDFASRTQDGGRLYAAARPAPEAPLVDVQLVGPFTRRLGVSDSCRALASALQQTGRSLRLCDYTLDHPNTSRDSGPLALAPPGPARVTILHLNLEDIPAAIAYWPDVFTDTRLVAFPYLELSKPEAVHRLGLELVDEVWAASRFIADTLGSHAPTHLLGTACKPVAAIGRSAARSRAFGTSIDKEAFVFLTAGDAYSGAHRKNPLVAIAAFRAAFPDETDVRLVVKTHSRQRIGEASERETWQAVDQAVQNDPRILLMDRVLEDDEMAALLEGADCLVSLHRAEGFGYHLIEAMRLGAPVVATAYSGNLDFCTPQTAWLVDCALRPIVAGEYPRASADQTWAEPDLASAVAALHAVRCEAQTRALKTAAARELVARDFSTDALAARVGTRLARCLGEV